MTMRIVFSKDHEGKKKGEEHFIQRSEALELIEKRIVMVPGEYVKFKKEEDVRKAAEAKKMREAAVRKAKKQEAAEARKAEAILKKKETAKPKQATSKRAYTRKKAVKERTENELQSEYTRSDC